MNYLTNSSSPYLLQHASNPVEWYPWGEASFTRAREEQKPIFLSIGYSTCHWCHVMAHESFENPEIAALLNRYFIAVKVDREERPDVDRLYMSYVQALTGRGGWPLSVWLTPELKPFFGGTYFPPSDAHGLIGFPSLLLQLATAWKDHRSSIEEEALRNSLLLKNRAQKKELKQPTTTLTSLENSRPMEQAVTDFSRSFDPVWGGFSAAPKFPQPSILFLLFRYASNNSALSTTQENKENQQRALKMVLLTLDKMAAGGLQDHLGGGFHRYSVDAIWQVPHFEKMLYDQAQLAIAYLEAWQITEEEQYRNTAQQVLDYVERDLTAPEGGFYSAEDADSLDLSSSLTHEKATSTEAQKKEGAFYCWSYEEIQSLLTAEEIVVVTETYGLRREGNIPPEKDPHGELLGKNILMVRQSVGDTASALGKTGSTVTEILEKAHGKLLLRRLQRPRPHRDDKILTAWNGLMISAYARCGSFFDLPKNISLATRAATFLKQHLYDPQTQQLSRSWRQGVKSEYGFAEDYAFLIQGLLDLYEATFNSSWLQWATTLQNTMDHLFWDPLEGGYFSSAESTPSVTNTEQIQSVDSMAKTPGDPYLLTRSKEEYDGAEPSANSIAALNLLRLGSLFAEKEKIAQAEKIFASNGSLLTSLPTAVPQLLVAWHYRSLPPSQCIVAGTLNQPDTQTLLKKIKTGFHPTQQLLLIDNSDSSEASTWLRNKNPLLQEIQPLQKNGVLQATLYRCENFCCQAPVTLDEMT